MKVAVFSLLVAVCVGVPLHHTGARHNVNVPDDCLFLESTESQQGDLTVGEYSYLDPRGSLVTVSWTDGPSVGYNEKRRVIKNYESGVSVATGSVVRVSTEQLVAQILGELESTVVETVQSAIISVDISSTSTSVLVRKIMRELRPVIRITIERVLAKNQVTDVNIEELMVSIVAQLEPFVSQTVETTIASIPRPLPQPVITATTTTTQVSDEEFLAKIIAQLKPVIVSTVQSSIKSSVQTTKPAVLPSKPVVIPAPVPVKPVVIPAPVPVKPVVSAPVVTGVTTTVETTSSSSNNVNSANLVTDIVSRLKPLILSEISRLTASQQTTVTTVSQPKPVVVQQVITVNKEEVRAKLITRIITNLRPALGEAITRTIRNANTNNEEELVRLIIAEMQPVILTTIRNTVTSEETQQLGIFSNSQSFNNFVTQIITRLRPVVAESVRILLESQAVNVEQVREEVIVRIISELRTTLTGVITRTIQSTNTLDEQTLVNLIITEIRPVIVSTLRSSVSQQESQQLGLFSTSASLDAFVDEIIVRLRVVITQSVKSLIQAREQEAQRQAQLVASTRTSVISRVIASVSGSLRQTVSAVMASSGTRDEAQLVSLVTAEVRLLIEDALRTLVSNEEADILGLVSQSDMDQLVADILIQMRASIVQMVRTILAETKVIVQQTVSQESGISKIFGVSGTNFVKVDTPSFNYGYEH